MSKTNKFGLKRSDLTSQQKRTIRQNAGFGCVVCGNAICEYEHVDPEFSEAKIHDPSAMAFLCIQCHGKVTKGHLSKASVKKAMKNPAALQKGFSFEVFDVGDRLPKIIFGPLSSTNCTYVIRVNDRPVFWIREAEVVGGPFRLNAEIRNRSGEIIFKISDNEWQVRTGHWDMEIKGQQICVRYGPRDIAFKLRTIPPSTIIIEHFDMSIEGYRLACDAHEFQIAHTSGRVVNATTLEITDFDVAVELKNGGVVFGHRFPAGSVSEVGSIKWVGGTANKKSSIPIEFLRRRKSICSCGSGKKYKHCCGSY